MIDQELLELNRLVMLELVKLERDPPFRTRRELRQEQRANHYKRVARAYEEQIEHQIWHRVRMLGPKEPECFSGHKSKRGRG